MVEFPAKTWENAINGDDTGTDVNRLDVFGSGRDTKLQQSGLPARMVICLCNPGFLSWMFGNPHVLLGNSL